VRAYGSTLDFPSSEADAVALAKQFKAQGFGAIKVKVGAPDGNRDIARLQAISRAVGTAVEITADANTIWDCATAVERLRAYEASGIHLSYIEDPLPHDEIEGTTRLARSLDLDIVGHDYASTPQQVRALLQAGIKRIRTGKDIEFSLACAALSQEFDAPLIFGNSFCEFNIHAACALPNVERLEYSALGWNDLMRQPVRFADGYGIAPEVSGHGLDPNFDVLNEWSRPEEDS
jgi:L-alanine-DL-glutamate epimerase-like enolase superfamily enzyme